VYAPTTVADCVCVVVAFIFYFFAHYKYYLSYPLARAHVDFIRDIDYSRVQYTVSMTFAYTFLLGALYALLGHCIKTISRACILFIYYILRIVKRSTRIIDQQVLIMCVLIVLLRHENKKIKKYKRNTNVLYMEN